MASLKGRGAVASSRAGGTGASSAVDPVDLSEVRGWAGGEEEY